VEFVNADVIASGLSAFNVESVAVQAGRIMLKRINDLAKRQQTFSLETTLAARSLAAWNQEQQEEKGYRFRLVYVWLRSPDLNVQRVAVRVRQGGHHIAEETIRRRYFRSIRNLFELYLPLADSWVIYDNSLINEPVEVAVGGRKRETSLLDRDAWSILRGQFDGGHE
jgi:predicted ABC-type ATPase